MAFAHSRRRWFGTCSCKPVPRGLPSSVKQLRTSSALTAAFVLVAHYYRQTGPNLIEESVPIRRYRTTLSQSLWWNYVASEPVRCVFTTGPACQRHITANATEEILCGPLHKTSYSQSGPSGSIGVGSNNIGSMNEAFFSGIFIISSLVAPIRAD
jgi:hypothetical protein